jgi:predicted amidophosphoribosyltransferase
MTKARTQQTVNCSSCGRDTRAASGICSRCTGRRDRYATENQAGCSGCCAEALDGSAVEDVEDVLYSIVTYHGPYPPDDI